MVVTKEEYDDLQENFTKVLELLDGQKLDSNCESYASKSSAAKILSRMEENLVEMQKNVIPDSSEFIKVKAMMGVVYLYLGIVSFETDEISIGESFLQKCLDVIEDFEDLSQLIMIKLNVYNQLGILWYQREPERSKSYFEKAEGLYLDCKKTNIQPADLPDLFVPNEENWDCEKATKNFEKVHTLTLYYLAQLYGTLQDTLRSSVYCHMTLQRQLDSGDYDPIDWALNAATLSQVFMEQNGFKQARHHLAASSYVLEEYEKKLNTSNENNEECKAKLESVKHRSADVARCWAKYGLLLLAKSKERLLSHTDDIEEKCSLFSDLDNHSLTSDLRLSNQHLEFSSLNLSEYECTITDKFILTLQDARPVFFNIQMWLQRAETFYKLEVLASDYIEIIQDKSQMYLNFLFFDDNVDNQAKLHKRRVDLLENVITKINPQYYLDYCRQIWYELGQTYSEILNIKCDKCQELKEKPTPHILTKINHLTDKSIYNFQCFTDSFKEMTHHPFTKIPDNFETAVLQALFHIGSLCRKFVVLDENAKIVNLERSYEAFKKVVDYCDVYTKARDQIPTEYSVCQEMVTLLPIRILHFRKRTVT